MATNPEAKQKADLHKLVDFAFSDAWALLPGELSGIEKFTGMYNDYLDLHVNNQPNQ